MQERPNYYLLLELAPSVEDWSVIEGQILEKKRRWAKDKAMGNPAARRKADYHLNLIKDIEETLKNPETRRLEANDALKRQSEEKQNKLKELDEIIGVLQAAGQVTVEYIKNIQTQLGGSLSEREIADRIRKAGVPFAQDSGPAARQQAKEFIDSVTAGSIKRNLDHLKIPNLYAFLDRSQRSSPKSLCERANEINKEILNIGRTDADASASKELCGICLQLFRDDKEKERYDNTLAIEAMNQLLKQIETAGQDQFISIAEMDVLVKQARKRGIDPDSARAFIEDFAKKRRWGVQSEGELPSASLKMCGYCLHLADSTSAERCTNCGELLAIACPQCAAPTPTQDRSCSKCGCHTGDAPVVKALLKEGQRLSAQGDMAGALTRIERALLYWPTWKELLDEKRDIETKQRDRESALRVVENLARERKLVGAREALDKLLRSFGEAGSESLKARIRDDLARAETAFRSGEQQRREGKPEEAIDKYEEALTLCADLEQARQAMLACPPPALAAIKAQAIANGMRITWAPVKARGTIRYRVIRKAQGIPKNDTDGELVGDVEGVQIDDSAVDSGIPWYYAAFTVRGGVPSRVAAASGPHLVSAEVKNLTTCAGDREVTLRWEAPKGCRRIEVWRNTGGAPARRGDGVRIAVAGDGAHDTDLINGAGYDYQVISVFEDPNEPGKEIHTPGLHASAFPVTPPRPVTDLVLRREGQTLTLNWTPVAGATVQIRKSKVPATASPGTIVPLEQANQIGALVASSSTGSAQASFTDQGRFYLVPLTVTASTAVIGAVAVITTVEDVTNLRAQTVGRDLVLTWEWPQGIDQVFVCCSNDSYPADQASPGATRVSVARAEYQRNNCWELRNVLKKPHYFTVFARAPQSDVCSAGASVFESMGQTAAVLYRVVLKKALLSRSVQEAWLEMECSASSSLPGLLIVGKQRNVPLSPTDGSLISEVGSVQFREGKARILIPQQFRGTNTYVKVFFKEAGDAQRIRLLPASKEELRLG